MFDWSQVRNPLWQRLEFSRDPGLIKDGDEYIIYYTRHASAIGDWSSETVWSVASTRTKDFVTFTDDRDISPKGYNSPSDPVWWHGRWILGYQNYHQSPQWMCFAQSPDLRRWSDPEPLLPQVRDLPWNVIGRAIDPHFVVVGEVLHCFFVGSAPNDGPTEDRIGRCNLLGHATTRDPKLQDWTIHSQAAPLMGESVHAPDGVENIAVVRTGDHWTMILSEGMKKQHLAYATSRDMHEWTRGGRIDLPAQAWMSLGQGAPTVWREGDTYFMLVMGFSTMELVLGEKYKLSQMATTFGLFRSANCIDWEAATERGATEIGL